MDNQVFERCVADLLRSDFPSLVPIAGGDDAGMDAAVADGQDAPIPVVVTTAEDVIGNLRRNLRRYADTVGKRDKAVLVTSRDLTPRKRRNLEDAATELGFTLLQIYDRDALADRLYGNSRWCRELLGLSGEPRPLSRIPESSRPSFDIPLIGRGTELQWLESTSGDRVVVGDPGSGKTFLVHQLVKAGNALYAVDDDRGRLADSLLDLRPEVVIVDDAHVRLGRLRLLRHLREEIDGFDLVVTTWRGAEAKVAAELGHPGDGQILRLELLPRNDIVEIFKARGVRTTDVYLRELVDQAANKPGLAVTLARLWHQGAYESLFRGSALADETQKAVEELLGEDESPALLACFALGGDRGVAMEEVGDFLRMSLADVQAKAANLSAAGILSEVDRETLAIWPRQLRTALLDAVFFGAGATALPWQRLFPYVASRRAAVETLALAKARGVDVPPDELERLVIEAGSTRGWQIYIQLGEREALLGLERYRGDRKDLLLPALSTRADSVIDRILDNVAAQPVGTQGGQSPALEALKTWVKDTEYPEDEIVDRRHRLTRRAVARLRSGADACPALEALLIALSPGLESTTIDPGAGNTVSIRSGILDVSAIQTLHALWEEIWPALLDLSGFDPAPLLQLAEETVDPRPLVSPEVIERTREARWSFARRVLSDVAALPWLTVGSATRARRLAEQLGLDLSLETDPDFEAVFPPHWTTGDYLEWEQERLAEVQELAARLSRQEPSAVAHRVAELKGEAEKAGRSSQGFTPQLAEQIALRVEDPMHWLHELQRADVPSGLLLSLVPFLDRVVNEACLGWEEALARSLRDERLARAAVWQVLKHPNPGDELLNLALAQAPDMADNVVETLCLQGRVSNETLLRLLEHADDDVAVHAAVGEWLAKPRGEVRERMLVPWREVILRARTSEFGGRQSRPTIDYWLRQILGSDAELAEAWLRRRIETAPETMVGWLYDEDHVVVHAVRALSAEQRERLLDDLQPGPALQLMSRLLVGRDATRYAALLERPELADAHLAPLEWGPPDDEWVHLARTALAAGKSSDAVAIAAFHGSHTMSGPFSAYWRRWEDAFADLTRSTNAAIRDVGVRGVQIAREDVEREQRRERSAALRGWQSA